MGKLKYLFSLYLFLLSLFFLLLLNGLLSSYRAEQEMERGRDLVRILGLTDLCLTTEARYTRNPSQADYFTPFQDNPMTLEFFPSGGAMAPPSFANIPRKLIKE